MIKHFPLLLCFVWLLATGCNSNKRIINSGSAVIQSIDTNKVLCKEEVSTTFDFLSDSDYTIYFLVRHAEKESSGKDPGLLPQGKERAENLSNILSKVNLDMVCASPFNRTESTARPTALSKQLEIIEYNPRKKEQAAYFTRLTNERKGARILVVGHSNSIPYLLNLFTESDVYKVMDHSIYDNFYMVAVKADSPTIVKQFKY